MELRTVVLMCESQGCFVIPTLATDGLVSAGIVARRAHVIPGRQYPSPHCGVHCWVLQEPVLHVEEPGRGLCVLSICLHGHASLKEQGFRAYAGFLYHLGCMWNRSKLLEAIPGFTEFSFLCPLFSVSVSALTTG